MHVTMCFCHLLFLPCAKKMQIVLCKLEGRYILCIKNKIKNIEIPVNYKVRIGTSKITGSSWNAFKVRIVMIFLILGYRFKK